MTDVLFPENQLFPPVNAHDASTEPITLFTATDNLVIFKVDMNAKSLQ